MHRALVQRHLTRLAIEHHAVVFRHHAESIGHREEAEVRGSGVHKVFAESELAVRQAELGKQRGGNVLLRAVNIHALRAGHRAAHQQKRYLVTLHGQRTQILWICTQVVGHQHHERVAPLRKLAEALYEIAHATVRIGKGVQTVVRQTAIGHFERFMAARCLQHAEARLAASGERVFLLHVVQQAVEHQVVVSTPLAKALRHGKILVAHNAGFDVGFIEQNCRNLGLNDHFVYLDTVALARVLLPTLSKYKLNVVAKALNISLENHHRAVDDAGATAEIFVKFVEMLKKDSISTLKEVNHYGDRNVNAIRKMPTHHIIILAKNDIGRYNLYQLITESHLTYYARRPRIPKSLLNEHREGLLVGSACEAGELYQAVLEKRSARQIAKLAEFYDYYEIQPLGNNRFMIESDRIPDVNSDEDLKNINREIVELGEKFGKPVVATCDVHFLDPDDEVYRRIIMAGKGFDDADDQAPLFLRTTEEMLDEFAYLGAAKAREIVVDNPVKIAGMIEKISPVNPNKCPPVIENSDQELRDICYRKAHEMYGEDLPVQVSERLEKELNSIISNGYAVMYIIAQKLVWKSNADGYLVGSRGSVGSSFVATMSGITEVNPLSPHYYCKKCHYSDFESDEVRAFAGGCGFDMPDKNCPVCGEPLVKAGFDIPF